MFLLEEGQIELIRQSIERRLEMVRTDINHLESLCDKDFLNARKNYPITAIIYTSFLPENLNLAGFSFQKKKYGKGRFLPELRNDNVLFQIYSDRANIVASKEIKENIKEFGDKYQLIIITVSKDTYHLLKIEQVIFDGITQFGNAIIKQKILLYKAT